MCIAHESLNVCLSSINVIQKTQSDTKSPYHGHFSKSRPDLQASDDPPASGENFFQTSANADPGEDAPTWTESLNEGFYDESRVVKAIL